MKQVELIAEIAQAHEGSLGILHSYIDALAECGVDTVKFQMHIAHAESSEAEPFRVNFSYEDKTRYDYWQRMQFSTEQWEGIKKHCIEKNLGFLCSPFSLEAVQRLKDLGERRVKIASGEVSNFLMHEAIAEFADEVLISSGLSDWAELEACVDFYRTRNVDVFVFQCTTAYPTPPEKAGLNLIPEIIKRFDCSAGLSDHSGEIWPGLGAVTLGAKYLEFHVVFHKKMFGPDASSSLDLDQIADLVKGVRFLETALENPMEKEISPEMRQMKDIFGKSLALNCDAVQGTVITREMLESKKPGNMGIPVAEFATVIGKKLKEAKQMNSFIRKEDIE